MACSYEDPVFQRNHYPRRTVLGIIGRDGAMAEYTSLPVSNLYAVPDSLQDEEAVFAEPVAAACRILEQQVSFWYAVSSNLTVSEASWLTDRGVMIHDSMQQLQNGRTT